MKKVFFIIGKIIYIALSLFISIIVAAVITLFNYELNLNNFVLYLTYLITPLFLISLLFTKLRKKIFTLLIIYTICILIIIGVNLLVNKYGESLVIKTDVNIDTSEYMPFTHNTKIVKLSKPSTLKITDNLPVLDGATAVFPVYSAFVNAVYPSNITFQVSPFLYTNTTNGYSELARKNIDIFFGAYPSKEQIEYAKKNNTTFKYYKIGYEGFVFFVNKNNPIDSLTIEQIKKIYSGKITNWNEVGGKDEEIIAFQRNEGSGSQSMLKRFMDGTKIMTPPHKQVNDMMSGIINKVSDYKNYKNSIGFSFRYYLEEIIANENVKMIKVNSIEPTLENIANGTYELTTPLYAVTYENNKNKNVELFINWILSDQGQEIIEKTGYAKVK